MSPENDGAEGQSAAPAEDAPTWAADALDALIGDDYSEADPTASPEGEPAESSALEPDGDNADAIEPGDGSTDTDASADDADEPDELKEILKGLTRTQKGVVLNHYRSKAETTLKEAQEIEDRTKAAAADRDAKAAEIREKRGKYIGEVEGQREDGTPVPTYKELERLLRTRGGDDVLEDKYGLSRDEAQDQLDAWDERKAMLDGSLDDFRTEAWVESGKQLATSVATAGLPIEAIWQTVKGIEDVVPSVVKHLTARHQAEIAGIKKDYDSRLRAANANGTAAAARTAARTMPQPETGGRGDSGGSRVYKLSELDDLAFFRAHEEDIDRAMSEGRIVPD